MPSGIPGHLDKEDIQPYRRHPGASSCAPVRPYASIGVLLSVQGVGHRLVDDEQVQSEAPVLDIPDVA